MFKIYDGRDYFYQWDINRKLIVNDESIKQVHFCNRTGDCSLVCETYKEDNMLVVDVPNILLQQDWRVRAYAYDGNATLHEALYDVKKRTKPDNYVYTETEILKYEYLKERVDQIEENGVSDETIAKAVGDYLKENDITVDLTGYATEKYVDDAIAAIEIPEVDLSAYYTAKETDKKIGDAISAIPKVDLTDYAKKSEIPSTVGLATVKYVDEKFSSVDVDLTGYATEDYVNKEIAKAQLSGDGDIDLDGFATEKYVDDAIANISLTPGPKGDPGYTPVKGVDYFDGKDGVDGKDGKDGYTPVKGVDYFDGAPGANGQDGKDYVLTEADKQEIAGMVEVSGGGGVSGDCDCIYVGETEPTNDSLLWINSNGEADEVEGITMADVEAAIEEALKDVKVNVDLTGYATETYVGTAIGEALDSYEPDLTGYATETYVGTTVNEALNNYEVDFTGYATEAYVGTAIGLAITQAFNGIKMAEEGAY